MLADFVESVTEVIQQIITVFGPAGVTLIALLENLFPPTPSEFLYPLAGKMAYDGQISPFAVVAAGVLGSLIGSLIFYTIGYWLGSERVHDLIARRGHFNVFGLRIQLVSAEDYDRALRLFKRYGGRIVFIARIMPLVHGVVSIPAGVVRMNLALFMTYTALGATCWIAPLTFFGYWLGDRWDQILYWLDIYQNIWYILIALAAFAYVWHRIRASKSRARALEQVLNQPTQGV